QDITHPDDLVDDQAFANRVLAGEIPHYTLEKRYVRKDGAFVWVNVFCNFVLDDDGRPVQGVGVAVDITERKRAETALGDSQQRLLLAKSAAQLGTHDWDMRTGLVQMDERAQELWGVRVDQPVRHDVFLGGIEPEDREKAASAIQSACDPAGDGRYETAF